MKLETQTEQLISETVTVYGLSPQIGVHALAQTANALAAQGTVFSVCPDITEDEETDTDIKNEDMQDTHETSASVSVQIAYPEYVFKSRIHKIEKLLKKACKKYNINLVAVQASANRSDCYGNCKGTEGRSLEPGNRTSLQGHRVRGSCGNGWHAQDYRRKRTGT